MDAIALARQAAARLHEQAVVIGHDPWKPYAFARVEAERRGLDVEVTASGAANLEDCLHVNELFIVPFAFVVGEPH
jgi:hypothetical protein